MNKGFKIQILKLIRFYKKTLSPVLHYLTPYCGCRFYPTCSEFTYKAIEKYGILKGGFKGLKRILKCHPFNLGGYDPL